MKFFKFLLYQFVFMKIPKFVVGVLFFSIFSFMFYGFYISNFFYTIPYFFSCLLSYLYLREKDLNKYYKISLIVNFYETFKIFLKEKSKNICYFKEEIFIKSKKHELRHYLNNSEKYFCHGVLHREDLKIAVVDPESCMRFHYFYYGESIDDLMHKPFDYTLEMREKILKDIKDKFTFNSF